MFDTIKTRTKRIYLSHPFMWRLEGFYDNITRLVRGRTVKEECTNEHLVRNIRDFREEMRIAKKYGFVKFIAHDYKMIIGIPIGDFPDSEFEERYATRNLHF
jgi:hypothetical protein